MLRDRLRFARVLSGHGKFKETRDNLLATMELTMLATGTNSAMTLECLEALAKVYWYAGEHKLAMGMLSGCYERSTMVPTLGPGHPDTANRLWLELKLVWTNSF